MKKLCVQLAALPLLASAACVGSSKSSNPLSPVIAGPIPGVGITAPIVVAPGVDATVDTNTQPITLRVANAETNGVRPLSYRFEIASDPNFTNSVFSKAGVPQDPFLFSATMAANIAYGVDAHDLPAIERAARVAHLDGEIESFPGGYSTFVGERGITLSGGQKQRTAIARAVLRDAPILLLDDCLSNVDTQTEEAILDGLRGEMRRRTTLLVSHRVSTVRDADLILVLDHGRIAERGRHAELLALGGHYAALHRAQQIEEEIAAS